MDAWALATTPDDERPLLTEGPAAELRNGSMPGLETVATDADDWLDV